MKVVIENDSELSGKEVRLAGDGRVLPFEQAVKISEAMNLDLVLISPNATPPVVKVTDYGKEVYARHKKEKANNVKVKSKEIKFHINIEKNDYNTKINNVKRFLSKKHKVKITIEYRGREMSYKDMGKELIQNILSDVEEVAKLENGIKEAGRKSYLMLSAR